MTTRKHAPSAFALVAFLVAAPVQSADLGALKAPGGSDPLVIPAGAFASDGDAALNYWITGEYISGGTGVTMRAPVYLPPHAFVTDVVVVAKDEHGAMDAHFYLHETPFGTTGRDVEIVHVQTTGSSTAMQYPADNNVDRRFDTSANCYWIEAYLPADTLRLYSVHIFYEDDVIFADGFESANNERWSSTTTGPAFANSGRPELQPARQSADDATASVPELLQLADPEAREALDKALSQRGYGSPAVVPGAAFKTTGSIDYDTYYISNLYGFVYARPGSDSVLVAPVNVPNGAHISFLMFFYRDSHPSLDIRFWLSRMNTWDGLRENLGFDTSSGANTAIRTLTFTSSDLTDPDVDYSHHSYWLTIDVEGYEFSQNYWHEVYAAVILYSLPTD